MARPLVEGIDIQRRDFESGFDSYLFGQRRNHGWVYYYAVGLFLKEPVAIWLLFATWLLCCGRSVFQVSRNELYSVAPGVAVFLLVSSQTGFNHHMRYVLPMFLVLYFVSAKAASQVGRFRWGKPALIAIAAWYCISSVLIVPRSYAFFSECIGGSRNGWQYMDNSNLDWGQDLYTAVLWAYRNPGEGPFYMLYSIPQAEIESALPNLYDGRDFLAKQQRDSPPTPAKGGTWIVFAQLLTQSEGAWFRSREADIELSPTIRVYRIADEFTAQAEQGLKPPMPERDGKREQ